MAKKQLRIYVENSVISAYHFAPKLIISPTRRFFEKVIMERYELFTSDVTIAELEKPRRWFEL
jgi:hypothetical protein